MCIRDRYICVGVCGEVTKRKDVFEGQHVQIVGVSKNYWRCKVLTGPEAGAHKKFLRCHVAKWLHRKRTPPQTDAQSGGAPSGAASAKLASDSSGDSSQATQKTLIDVFGNVDGY